MMDVKKVLFTALLCSLVACYARGQDSTHSYLALGDSYTIGERVDPSKRWPVQLVDSLQKREVDIANPKIIAKTGWTTLDLKKAIRKAEPDPPYDLVSLLIGVNDQYQGNPIKKYAQRFQFLLGKAIALSGSRPNRVVVLSIPDYGLTPFGQEKNPKKISREIEQYNSINKSIADRLGVHYVDITSISKRAQNNPSLIATDGLHPSGKMYQLWVKDTLPVVSNFLH